MECKFKMFKAGKKVIGRQVLKCVRRLLVIMVDRDINTAVAVVHLN